MPEPRAYAQTRARVIRQWRREVRCYNQEQAAEHVGISLRTYRKLEDGTYLGGFSHQTRRLAREAISGEIPAGSRWVIFSLPIAVQGRLGAA